LPAGEIQRLPITLDAAPIVSALLAKREMPLATLDTVPVTAAQGCFETLLVICDSHCTLSPESKNAQEM